MANTSKNTQDNQSSANQRLSSSSSILSNSKWFVIVVISIALVAIALQRRSSAPTPTVNRERLFTLNELRTFTNEELYLAILGHVFNVTSAPKFYSQKGSYGHFTGRDASRAFHTGGHAPEDLTDDLTGLKDEDIAGIYNWLLFYQKQYSEIGKLIGRYFNADGLPTEHFAQVLQSVEKMKKKEDENSRFEQKWPPCNSEWSHLTGRRVWCTKKSGGIERSWIGFPRRHFDASTKTERCVCVENPTDVDQHFKEYPDCSSNSFECQIRD